MEQLKMNTQLVIDTAMAMVADDHGLLAIDESQATCNKRFAELGITQTEGARRANRDLIITTPGLGESISGVILFDETLTPQRTGNYRWVIWVKSRQCIRAGQLRSWGRFPDCYRPVSANKLRPDHSPTR